MTKNAFQEILKERFFYQLIDWSQLIGMTFCDKGDYRNFMNWEEDQCV